MSNPSPLVEPVTVAGRQIGCVEPHRGKWRATSRVDAQQLDTNTRKGAENWLRGMWRDYQAKERSKGATR